MYNNLQHGTSLATLYAFAKDRAPTMLLLSTDPKPSKLLGAFLTEPLVPHGRKFFGTPDTRLFRFHPHFEAFPASFRDSMFMYAGGDGFGLGGGGNFGIFISDDLLAGCTNECDTFSSPQLLDETEFSIRVVELWQLLL